MSEILSATATSIEALRTAKQDKLVAGENITIAPDGKTISANCSGTPSDYETVKADAATGATHAGIDQGNPHNTTIGDIDQLGQRLDSADGNIQTAQSAADAAQSTANDAVGKAEDAQSRIGTIEGAVYQHEGPGSIDWWFKGEAWRAELAFSADALSDTGKSALFAGADFKAATKYAKADAAEDRSVAVYTMSAELTSITLPTPAANAVTDLVVIINCPSDVTIPAGFKFNGTIKWRDGEAVAPEAGYTMEYGFTSYDSSGYVGAGAKFKTPTEG